MKLVKKSMTLEEYKKKYPHYKTTLLSFSEEEIKEFNSVFRNQHGKENPDKYALLNKYKWVHIKDRYYQVPRISKLGKTSIAILFAGAVSSSIAVPLIVLNNNKPIDDGSININENQFKESLNYFTDLNSNTKFKVECKITFQCEYASELDLPDEYDVETTISNSTEVTTYDLIYQGTSFGKRKIYYTNKNNEYYIYDTDMCGEKWYRYSPVHSPSAREDIVISFQDYKNNFSKFKKASDNTLTGTMENVKSLLDNWEIEYEKIKNVSTCDITFNSNKTIKKIKDVLTATYNGGDKFNKNFDLVMTSEYNFIDVGTAELPETPPFVDPNEVYQMKYSSWIYPHYTLDMMFIYMMSNNLDTTFKITLINDENGDVVFPSKFIVEGYDITRTIIEHLNFNEEVENIFVINKKSTGTTETLTTTVDENGDLKIEKPQGASAGDEISIQFKPKKSIYEAYSTGESK